MATVLASVSKFSALEAVAPESPAPESPAPESPALESPAPESPAPEAAAPESLAPEAAAPEAAAPEAAAPEAAAPESPAPEAPAQPPIRHDYMEALVRAMPASLLFATYDCSPEFREHIQNEMRGRRLVLTVTGWFSQHTAGTYYRAEWRDQYTQMFRRLHTIFWLTCGTEAQSPLAAVGAESNLLPAAASAQSLPPPAAAGSRPRPPTPVPGIRSMPSLLLPFEAAAGSASRPPPLAARILPLPIPAAGGAASRPSAADARMRSLPFLPAAVALSLAAAGAAAPPPLVAAGMESLPFLAAASDAPLPPCNGRELRILVHIPPTPHKMISIVEAPTRDNSLPFHLGDCVQCPPEYFVRHLIITHCSRYIGEVLRAMHWQLERLEVYEGDQHLSPYLDYYLRRFPVLEQLTYESPVSVDLRSFGYLLRHVQQRARFRGLHKNVHVLTCMQTLVHLDIEMTGDDLDKWTLMLGAKNCLRRLDLLVHGAWFTQQSAERWPRTLLRLRELRMHCCGYLEGKTQLGLQALMAHGLAPLHLCTLHLSSQVQVGREEPLRPELAVADIPTDVRHLALELNVTDRPWLLTDLMELESLQVHVCRESSTDREAERCVRHLLHSLCRANQVQRIRLAGVERMCMGDRVAEHLADYTRLRRLEIVRRGAGPWMVLPAQLAGYGFAMDSEYLMQRDG